MASNESTDPRVQAQTLNEYRLAKQAQMLARAEQQRPNTEVQRAAHAVLVAGIPPATKPQKDQQDTP